MQYDSTTTLVCTGAYVEVDSAYIWDPAALLTAFQRRHSGHRIPLWSETVTNMDEIEFGVSPPGRACRDRLEAGRRPELGGV